MLKLKILLILLFALVIVDGVITNYMVDNNIAIEGNPLLAGIAGDNSLFLVKAIGGLLVLWLLWRRAKKKYLSTYRATAVFNLFYIAIVGWNLYLCSTLTT